MAIEINGKTIETMKDLDEYIKSLQNEVKELTSTIDTLKTDVSSVEKEMTNTVKSITTTTGSFVTGLTSATTGTMYLYILNDSSTHTIKGDEDIGGASISARLALIFNTEIYGIQIYVIMYTTANYWISGTMSVVCWAGDGRIMVDDVIVTDWTELSYKNVSKSSAITEISTTN